MSQKVFKFQPKKAHHFVFPTTEQAKQFKEQVTRLRGVTFAQHPLSTDGNGRRLMTRVLVTVNANANFAPTPLSKLREMAEKLQGHYIDLSDEASRNVWLG